MKNSQNKKVKFPPESAGRMMTAKVPISDTKATIADIEKALFGKTKEFETINYIYIIDKNRRIKGVISIKDIFCLPKTTLVSQIMKKKLVSVRSHTDQERVALLALQHNLKAIPVVDKKDHLLGVVSSDVILNILHDEDIEDILRFAGVGKLKDSAVSLIKASPVVHFRKRFPWLVLGLFGGMISAFIVESFETSLRAQLILAAFIPTIVYLADALGTQTETIFIRSMALNERLNIKKYLCREIQVSFFLALSLGLIISLLSLLWQKLLFLGLILGLSVFIGTMIAMAVAVFLPWILFKLKRDPVFAAGPLGTIIRDILSILIYFSIASLVMKYFL